MTNLKPMTREESLISGVDLTPMNRHEYYLKYLKGKGNGGGSSASNVMVIEPITIDDIKDMDTYYGQDDAYGAAPIDVVMNGTGTVVYAYRIVNYVEDPDYILLRYNYRIRSVNPNSLVNHEVCGYEYGETTTYSKCEDIPDAFAKALTIDKTFESEITPIFSLYDGEVAILLPEDVNVVPYWGIKFD